MRHTTVVVGKDLNPFIVTMDDHQREIPDGGLFIRDGFIEEVGQTGSLPDLYAAYRLDGDAITEGMAELLLPQTTS